MIVLYRPLPPLLAAENALAGALSCSPADIRSCGMLQDPYFEWNAIFLNILFILKDATA